jgi:SAM-dependent methyltransferase
MTVVSDDRDTLKRTFDQAADLYALIRPGYPDRLFEDLESLGRVPASARVVEIGCGTGQATRSLALRGWRVTAVELGGSLAEVARRELGGFADVEVVTASFERWEPPQASFDAVFAATSWHWLDPAVAFEKAAYVLAADGLLAIVSTHHVQPVGGDDFFEQIQQAYAAVGEADPRGHPLRPEDVGDDLAAEITASGWFSPPVVRRYLESFTYTAEEYVSLLSTYSGHIMMSADQRAYLFTEIRRRIGERTPPRVRKHYLNVLHVARVRR